MTQLELNNDIENLKGEFETHVRILTVYYNLYLSICFTRMTFAIYAGPNKIVQLTSCQERSNEKVNEMILLNRNLINFQLSLLTVRNESLSKFYTDRRRY